MRFHANVCNKGSPVTIRSRLLVLLAAAALNLFIVASAHAAEYYMSPSGSDSNPGTLSAPWKSMDRLQVAQSSLRSGDTVNFRGGDYMVSDSDRFAYYSWRTPNVTYRNYNGETPVIVWDRVQPRENHSWIIYISGSNSTIDGLNFLVTERSRRLSQRPDGTTIKGNKIVPGGLVYWSSGLKIRNCSITGFALGVGAYGPGSLVENCKIGGGSAHGFYIGAANGTFRYNELDGSRGYGNSQGIQIQYVKASGNKIYGNLLKNGMASGVVLSGRVANNEIFNNVFVNAGHQKLNAGVGWAINFWCEDGPIGPGNKIYNNTFIGTSRHGLITSGVCNNKDNGQPLGRNVQIYNNIFHPSTPVRVGLSLPNVRNNIFYNVTGSVPPGNILVNPNLKNPGGTTSADAMLQEGSPAIDKATSGAPALDYQSGKRPVGAAADIGAFEFGAPPGNGGGPLGGGSFPPSSPVLLGPNGEVCPTGYL